MWSTDLHFSQARQQPPVAGAAEPPSTSFRCRLPYASSLLIVLQVLPQLSRLCSLFHRELLSTSFSACFPRNSNPAINRSGEMRDMIHFAIRVIAFFATSFALGYVLDYCNDGLRVSFAKPKIYHPVQFFVLQVLLYCAESLDLAVDPCRSWIDPRSQLGHGFMLQPASRSSLLVAA